MWTHIESESLDSWLTILKKTLLSFLSDLMAENIISYGTPYWFTTNNNKFKFRTVMRKEKKRNESKTFFFLHSKIHINWMNHRASLWVLSKWNSLNWFEPIEVKTVEIDCNVFVWNVFQLWFNNKISCLTI